MPILLEQPAAQRAEIAPRRPAPVRGLLCLGLPLAVFAATLLVLGVQYEVNDDALISCIAAGAYGGDTVHLCYVNILLGLLFKPFYLLAPAVNWYVALSIAAVLGCFAVLAFLCTEKLGTLPGLCLWGIGMLLAGMDALHAFQYTKNAAILAVTGFLLLARAVAAGRYRGAFWGGAALIFAAACLRWESFAAVGAMALPLLTLRLAGAKNRRGALLRLAAAAAACLAAWAVNEAAYRLDPAWNTWRQYNAARTEISDHRLQYLAPADAAAYGLSEADYALLASWDYGDTSLFSTEELAALAAALPHRTPLNAVRETLANLPEWLFTTPPGWLLCLAALMLLLAPAGSRTLWAALATLAVFNGCAWALFYGGRTPWRVEYLLLAPAAVLLLALWAAAAQPAPDTVFLLPPKQGVALLLICFVATYGSNALLYEAAALYREDNAAATPKMQAMAQLLGETDGLYLVSTVLEDDLAGKNVWAAPQKGAFAHLSFLGGWAAQSPLYAAALSAQGLAPATPLADAVDAENVYLVDFAGVEDKVAALREHLGLDVRAEAVRSCDYYTVYRLVTG